jgi:hypothetical protein
MAAETDHVASTAAEAAGILATANSCATVAEVTALPLQNREIIKIKKTGVIRCSGFFGNLDIQFKNKNNETNQLTFRQFHHTNFCIGYEFPSGKSGI